VRVLRRFAAVAAAVMVVGGLSLSAAPGASAVDVFVDNGDGTLTFSGMAGVTNVVNFCTTDVAAENCLSQRVASVSAFANPQTLFSPMTFAVGTPTNGPSTLASGCYNVNYTSFSTVLATISNVAIGDVDCGSGTAAADGADTPIPAWVQAYGRASKDATCIDGWNPSWNLWPNDGKGGWVCTRSIPSLG